MAARLLVIAIGPVLVTSCTAAVRDVGFVTQGDEITAPVGVFADLCSQPSDGAASMARPIPVYPRATLPLGNTSVRAHFSDLTVPSAEPIPISPQATPILGDNVIPPNHARILESDDSWQTIVRWYRAAMPKGAERVMKPSCRGFLLKNISFAQFSVGKLGKDYRDVLIMGVPANQRLDVWPQGKEVPRTFIVITDR
jgi:hypothetical protein